MSENEQETSVRKARTQTAEAEKKRKQSSSARAAARYESNQVKDVDKKDVESITATGKRKVKKYKTTTYKNGVKKGRVLVELVK